MDKIAPCSYVAMDNPHTLMDTGLVNAGHAENGHGRSPRLKQLLTFLADCIASLVLWYILLFCAGLEKLVLCVILVLLIAWRVVRLRGLRADDTATGIPYTCSKAVVGGKELYIVATLHISPRAPRDVREVIERVRPDIVMIELDQERLDDMSDAGPSQAAFQQVQITLGGEEPFAVRAQRAIWNAEHSGETIAGRIVFDTGNEYGIGESSVDTPGSILLVRRGGPPGSFAPFALKAHIAFQRGATCLLVMNNADELHGYRLGEGTLCGDIKVARLTRSCGFPPIPVLLVTRSDGERLRVACCDSSVGASGSLEVLADDYPRSTLRRRLCQACVITFSGVGALYGVIQCFAVDVGAEFTVAETEAAARGIPCVCIDVDMNTLCGRASRLLLPTFRNLWHALSAWISFPRALLRICFPAPDRVDVIGSTILHVLSFRCRTWIAFAIAGACACGILTCVLALFSTGAEAAGEGAGVVDESNRDAVVSYIILAIEFYAMPRLYEAVAASRDEAMYRGIVAKAQEGAAQRLVVVVGAAHANGILDRVHARGLY